MKKEYLLFITEEESNVLLNALNKARGDSENSSLATKHYTDVLVKLTEYKYGKGSTVL